MSDSLDKALNQSLANTLLLVENWAKLDTARASGQITAEDQVKNYSDYVQVIGVALFTLLDVFPEVGNDVVDLMMNNQITVDSLIKEGFGHNS